MIENVTIIAVTIIGKDQSLKLEVKERPDVGVFVKVGIKQTNVHSKLLHFEGQSIKHIRNISRQIFCQIKLVLSRIFLPLW